MQPLGGSRPAAEVPALVEFIAVPILKRKCNLRACRCCRRGGVRARASYQSVKKDEMKWPIPTWMTETKIPPAGNEVTVPVRRRDELSLGETRPWISFSFFSFFPFRCQRNRYHFLFSSFSLRPLFSLASFSLFPRLLFPFLFFLLFLFSSFILYF